MSVRIIKARDLKLGDVLGQTPQRGPITVKNIYVVKNPLFGFKEVTVRGPLGVVDKFHENTPVSVLN